MWISESGERYSDEGVIDFLLPLEAQCILIQGPTGCGKTTLIKRVIDASSRETAYYTVDQLVSAYSLDDFVWNGYQSREEFWARFCAPILIIDDADLLSNHVFCKTGVAFRLRQAIKKSLVILIGIDISRRVPDLWDRLHPITTLEFLDD